MRNDFRKACIPPTHTLSQILENLNVTGYKTALVVDDADILLGIVTDWDIRSALLNGTLLTAPADSFMNRNPHVGEVGMNAIDLRELMLARRNECLPIVDADRKVVDFVLLRDFVEKDSLMSPIVIMAGGAGKRLWPLTEHTPKPLLPVANVPLLGHILNHVEAQGFGEIKVMTHYKSEMIEGYLAEHGSEGLDISVIKEENPLGTAGSLKGLEKTASDKPIFIMNGDILTTLDFQDMLHWHTSHGNILTMCSRHYPFQLPYGLLETEGQAVTGIREKPVFSYNINAGIYLIEKEALQYIPEGKHFDMTDLIDALIANDKQVGAFPISEAWIDIGQPEDYTRVNKDSHQYLPLGVS